MGKWKKNKITMHCHEYSGRFLPRVRCYYDQIHIWIGEMKREKTEEIIFKHFLN